MCRLIRYAVALSMLPGVLAVRASAQTNLLQPSVQVRIPALGKGMVALRTRDSVYIMMKGGALPRPFALSSLPPMEIRGEKDRGAGAVRGGIIGAAIGAVGGLAAWASGDSTNCKRFASTGQEYDCQRKFNAGDALTVTAGGAFLGAGIGALIGRRSWYPINVAPATSQLEWLPGRRLALTVRLR